MKKKIKLFDPCIDKKEEKEVISVLKSGFWTSGSGTGKVVEFEKKFKKYVGAKSCICVNSGTAALHLALSLFNIKDKEVILPSLSFVSTAHSIMYNGGKPVFVDVDPKTLCLDPEKIQNAITKNTKVILPVHFGGMPCELNKISKLGFQKNIKIVEDAAHAAGASYNNKKIGSFGNVVCFSFHPVKNLGMPTGGAITLNDTNSKKYEKILKALRWCGISNRVGTKYDVTHLGWNYYMNEFSAAIGIEQLKKLKKMNLKRMKIAKTYSEEIELESMPFDKNCSYHLYWILVQNREKFMKNMKNMGIETGIHYKPIHKMKFYSIKKKLPVTDDISSKIVSIPMHPKLNDNDVDRIIKLTNKFSK